MTTIAATFARHQALHDEIAKSHPSLIRGMVWCRHCNKSRRVDPAECLRSGWPKCCKGTTMSIEKPAPVKP
jgi:L-rhamnose isomerase